MKANACIMMYGMVNTHLMALRDRYIQPVTGTTINNYMSPMHVLWHAHNDELKGWSLPIYPRFVGCVERVTL